MYKPINYFPEESSGKGSKKVFGLFFSLFAALLIGAFGFLLYESGWLTKVGTATGKISAERSCRKIEAGFAGAAFLCVPRKNVSKMPAVVATGGYGSTAEGTQKVCGFFVGKGFVCLALDSSNSDKNRNESDTVADIRTAVDYLKTLPEVDAGKINLWGGSNGALTSLMAASGRTDIDAVAALSAPLIYEFDKDDSFAEAAGFDADLIYVYGEDDFTDTQTAGELCKIARGKGRRCESVMIPKAGHEICCYNPPLLGKMVEFIVDKK